MTDLKRWTFLGCLNVDKHPADREPQALCFTRIEPVKNVRSRTFIDHSVLIEALGPLAWNFYVFD